MDQTKKCSHTLISGWSKQICNFMATKLFWGEIDGSDGYRMFRVLKLLLWRNGVVKESLTRLFSIFCHILMIFYNRNAPKALYETLKNHQILQKLGKKALFQLFLTLFFDWLHLDARTARISQFRIHDSSLRVRRLRGGTHTYFF